MKAHIGADAASGLVHGVTGTAASVSDISQTCELLHGEEKVVHADAGCIGVEKREEIIARHSGVEWRVAARRGKLKGMPESWVKDLTLGFEKLKARTRALVEHPFHIVKDLFKFRKVRYRGLRKNTAQLEVLFALGQSGHRQEASAERGMTPHSPTNSRKPSHNHPGKPSNGPQAKSRRDITRFIASTKGSAQLRA